MHVVAPVQSISQLEPDAQSTLQVVAPAQITEHLALFRQLVAQVLKVVAALLQLVEQSELFAHVLMHVVEPTQVV